MFNKKRIFVFFVFILLLFFLMTFGGSGRTAKSYRTITFIDGFNDTVIKTIEVEVGKNAKVPENPVHEGCDFKGWYDKENVKIDNFTGITENLTVYAECDMRYFDVTFYDTVAKDVIKVDRVKYGENAKAPKAPSHDGYIFDGWSRGYTNVKSNFQVNANYSKQIVAKYYSVKFYDGETNELINTEVVKEGLSATFPEIPTHKNKVYDHFEGDYTNVTEDRVVTLYYVDAVKYNVSFNSGLHGKLNNTESNVIFSVFVDNTFEEGGVVTPTVNADEGYSFTGWDIEFNKDTVVTGDLTYTAEYEINSYNLTIHYKYTDGSEAAEDYTTTLDYNSNYLVNSPKITGYTANRFVVFGKMGAEDKEITVYYNINYYLLTVNYLHTNGFPIAFSKIFIVKYNENYDVDSPYIKGFTPDKSEVTGTMDAHNVNVNVIYSINSYNLTINYKFSDGSIASEKYTDTKNYLEFYSVKSPKILGYTPTRTLVYGTMDAEDREENVIYNANTYKLTVHYKYSDGTRAARDKVVSVKYKDTYTVNSPELTGYTADQAVVTGTMGPNNADVTVTYTANIYNLTVHYVYSDGTKAAEDYTGKVAYKAAYNVSSPTLTGYTPSQAAFKGTMGAADVEVTVIYSTNSYDLTVHYVYSDGTKAAEDYTGKVNYNSTYTVNSPAITGYTADEATVTGKMGAANKVVTVTYTANKYNLTIHYVYSNGDKAANDYTEKVSYKDTYTVASPVLTGYTADKTSVTGTMIADDVVVTVTYSTNSYDLTIHYVYSNGTKAAEDHTEEVAYKSDYSVTSPTLNGYTPSQAMVAGTMGTGNVEVTVTYVVNSYDLLIHYVYSNGTKAAEDHTEEVAYKSDYRVTSPVLTGYTPSQAMVAGTMGTSDVEVTVTYATNSYDLTIHYVYSDGTKAANDYTEEVTYKNTYNVTSPSLTGYTASQTSVSGTMGADDVTVTVTYTANKYDLTIYYVYSDGTEASEDYTGKVSYKDTYTVASPTITGYIADKTSVTGTMGTSDIEVTVIYTANSYDLTIHYLYVGGAKAADDYTGEVTYKSTYSIVSPVITGYTANLTTVSGTMGTNDTTIYVYYDANDDTAYTVEYYKDNSATPFETESKTGTTGATATADIIAVTGYEIDSTNINNVLSGTISGDGSLVLKVYYKKSMINYTVNVYYDNVLNSTNTYSAEFNSVIDSSTYAGVVAGYRTPTYTPSSLTISAVAENNVINVYYVSKAANINVDLSRTIMRNGVPVTDSAVEYGDIITYSVRVTNTGDASGSLNIKDLELLSDLNNTMTIDRTAYTTAQLAVIDAFLSNGGYNLTVNANGEYTLTFNVKVTGNVNQSVSSQVTYTIVGGSTQTTSTITLNIEKVISFTEISENGANVVLVLDNSGSMKENGKLQSMKDAATQFINSLLGSNQNPNNEICLVIMPDNNGDTAQYECDQNANTIINYMNSKIDGSGWTPYTSALNGANGRVDYLKSAHAKNGNYVIFLTDGEPIVGRNWGGGDIYDNEYTTVANTIKTKATLYTIGFNTNTDAENRLISIASPGKYYSASNSNVNTVFDQISKAIGTVSRRTVNGLTTISSNIDTSKKINIKITHVNGSVDELNKTLAQLISSNHIINSGTENKLDASKFLAGDKIEVTYYLLSTTISTASFSRTMLFVPTVVEEPTVTEGSPIETEEQINTVLDDTNGSTTDEPVGTTGIEPILEEPVITTEDNTTTEDNNEDTTLNLNNEEPVIKTEEILTEVITEVIE